MKYSLVIFSLICSFNSLCQVVESSCEEPDSISDLYAEDAARLAVRQMLQDPALSDSILISDWLFDSYYDAIKAIHNSSGIPERDTVIDHYWIHSRMPPRLDKLIITAQPELPWVMAYASGELISGDPTMDSLATWYELAYVNYAVYPWGTSATMNLRFENPLNLEPLVLLYGDHPDVNQAYIPDSTTDGPNITGHASEEYTELVFDMGFGDCPAGCFWHQFWHFRVYPDCSVEYLGTSLEDPLNIQPVPSDQRTIHIHPNPFSDVIRFDGMFRSAEYAIFDMSLKLVATGRVISDQIDVEDLSAGTYILRVQDGNSVSTQKMVKH